MSDNTPVPLSCANGGREVHIESSTVFISDEKLPAALERLRQQSQIKGRWTCRTVNEALKTVGFTVETVPTGLAVTDFDGPSHVEQQILLLLAPFVDNGSHVNWINDKNDRWGFVYEDGMATIVGHH